MDKDQHLPTIFIHTLPDLLNFIYGAGLDFSVYPYDKVAQNSQDQKLHAKGKSNEQNYLQPVKRLRNDAEKKPQDQVSHAG